MAESKLENNHGAIPPSPRWLRILLVIVVFLLPGIGGIVGIIGGAVLSRRENALDQYFGRSLVIVGSIMAILSSILCLIFMIFIL